MTPTAKRSLQIGVGFGLSALFIHLALKGEDWTGLSQELAVTKVAWLLPMVLVGLYSIVVRAQRWRILLEYADGRRPSFDPVFSASAIGFMANMLLPLRIGEVVRPYLVSRRTEIPFSTALATVVLERMLDLFVLFLFASWVVMTEEVPDIVRNLTVVAGSVALVGVISLTVLYTTRQRLVPVLDRLWAKLPGRLGERIASVEHEFLNGIAALASPSALARTLLWSLWLWLVIALCFSFGLTASGISVPFLPGGVTLVTIVALAVSIPSAPAFIGQFQWGCKVALVNIYAVEGARALSYSIVTHLTQAGTQIGLGLVYLLREGLSFSDLRRLEAQVSQREELSDDHPRR